MFIDEAKIKIKAGKGGDGLVSFRREKYVPNGGPDGGDGGKGGDIIFIADANVHTLADFRYRKKYVGNNGEDGGARNCSGRSGEDITIKVPVGTIIKDDQADQIIADLNSEGQVFTAAKGGKGGSGNQHFATSTRQVPNFAKKGSEGEERDISLELKLLADVGLIGFPNVGKSTLLSRVSSAKPKIANYHFTTLTPNLGVVRVDREFEFVIADIPGLIEGAHEGTGLGHEFLRHIERTKLLIHVVDVSGSEGRDPVDDFEKVNKELYSYSEKLKQKPQIAAGNKADIDIDGIKTAEFIEKMEAFGVEVFIISAATGNGVGDLMNRTAELVRKLPSADISEISEEIKEYVVKKEAPFRIEKVEDYFVIEGEQAVKLVQSVNLDDYESLSYFQRKLRMLGIIDKLKDAGVKEGDTVCIGDFEFDYME